MKVTFKNIGAVQEVTIDLTKRLNVFCGPNNTGKTYVAYCLYGLMKVRGMSSMAGVLKKSFQLPGDFIAKGFDGIGHFQEMRTALKGHLEQTFLRESANIFGIQQEAKERLFQRLGVNVAIPTSEDMRPAFLNAEFYGASASLVGEVEIVKYKNADRVFIRQSEEVGKKGAKSIGINSLLNGFLGDCYLDILLPTAFIAPVERNSIFTFSKELAIQRNDLVDEMLRLKSSRGNVSNPYDLLERRATRYPMAIRDGLDIAEDLANYKKQTSEFAHFADELENTLLGGKIIISKEGQVEFAPARAPRGTRLPMHIAASVVKSFAAIIIYLRHLATPGDCIIIDEPELNLHPDAQIQVARILARMANEGFHVVISTHSDYIIRELNNLMMAHGLAASGRKKSMPKAYTAPGVVLDPDTVAATLFQYGTGKEKNKVKTETLEITETGFEVETIDRIIAQLNQTSQQLYFNIHSSEAEEEE